MIMDRYQLTSVDYDARQGRTACFSSGMTGHFTGSSRRLKLALLREGESLEPHTQGHSSFLGTRLLGTAKWVPAPAARA